MIRLTDLLTEGSSPELTPGFKSMVQQWENSKAYKPGGWNAKTNKWYPHKSPEGGTPTIAYGHKLTSTDISTGRFKNGLTDDAAKALFDSDLEIARSKAIALVPSYASLPTNTKQALVNACYRGELSNKKTPNTLKLMRAGKWISAAAEYLDHEEYRSTGHNVKSRMDWNATQFKNTSNSVKAKPTTSTTSDTSSAGLSGAIDYVQQQFAKANTTTSPTYHVVRSGDTLSGIAVKYKTTVPSIKKINNLTTDSIKLGQKLKVK